jgi:hypothetical protein
MKTSGNVSRSIGFGFRMRCVHDRLRINTKGDRQRSVRVVTKNLVVETSSWMFVCSCDSEVGCLLVDKFGNFVGGFFTGLM